MEVLAEIPIKAAKSIGITTTIGTAMTFGSSLFVFRDIKIVGSDLRQAAPVLGLFSIVDFTINHSITKALGKRRTERWICCASGATAGASCGWYFGKSWKPTVFGGILGGVYGAVRNYPLEMFGLEPY